MVYILCGLLKTTMFCHCVVYWCVFSGGKHVPLDHKQFSVPDPSSAVGQVVRNVCNSTASLGSKPEGSDREALEALAALDAYDDLDRLEAFDTLVALDDP